jgi:hypothetical protein
VSHKHLEKGTRSVARYCYHRVGLVSESRRTIIRQSTFMASTSSYARLLELFQRVDPLLRSRMGGEEPSLASALRLYEPSQRINHHVFGIAGTRTRGGPPHTLRCGYSRW